MPTPDKKRRRRFVVLAAAILIVAVLVILRANRKTKADYYILKPIDLNYTILANCTVDYPRPLDMSFQTGGIILAVEVADGERVSHGQTLVRIDDFEARRNLAIREDNLRSAELKLKNAQDEVLPSLAEKLRETEGVRDQAERTLKRYREIEAAGGISKAEVERADREYQTALSRYNQQKLELENYSRSGRLADLAYQVSTAKSQLELAQRDLENTRLAAPFEGTVVKVDVQPGERAIPAMRGGDPPRERQLAARPERRSEGAAVPEARPYGRGHDGRLSRDEDRRARVLRLRRGRQGEEHLRAPDRDPEGRRLHQVRHGRQGRDPGREVREGPGPALEVREEGRGAALYLDSGTAGRPNGSGPRSGRSGSGGSCSTASPKARSSWTPLSTPRPPGSSPAARSGPIRYDDHQALRSPYRLQVPAEGPGADPAPALAGIAIGVAVQFFISSLIGGLQLSLIDRTVGSAPHVFILPSDSIPTSVLAGDGAAVDSRRVLYTENREILSWKSYLDFLKGLPEVTAACPVAGGQGLIERGGASDTVAVKGIEPGEGARIYNFDRNLQGGRSGTLRGQARSSDGRSRTISGSSSATGSSSAAAGARETSSP